MKLQILALAFLLTQLSAACSLPKTEPKPLAESTPAPTNAQFSRLPATLEGRSMAIREKLAAEDLNKLDAWWQRENIGDPHKYLLPVILARLSLGERYNRQQSWDILMGMERDKPSIYHFRTIYDVRIFFLFRDQMPDNVTASYRSMLGPNRVLQWVGTGTENHMFMKRTSGLALMDGSGFPNGDPASAATNEAWLRSELNKFMTIGQGEFHSSTYYGYSIAGLLNLYDFAKTPELKQLAKATLDWYAANMALRLSWGTAGGAESRGFDRGTWDSGMSAVSWIWWGDSPEAANRMDEKSAWLALPAALSTYRPPVELRAIARKEIPLPFQAKMSHPGYYSYFQSNRMWETFYVTSDYSLATLIEPQRSYQVKGTINAQYATYKLVVRDPKGQNNAVISLAGTFHTPMATGRSPGDQYVQERGAVIYQLRLNNKDKAAKVPARSHLVLPARYGQPQRHRDWYIWRIENTWLCARPWGDNINWQNPVSERDKNYQALVATGDNTAWITDVARVADYPDLASLKTALDKTSVDDKNWNSKGEIGYTSLLGDRIVMTYAPNGGIARANINSKERLLKDWHAIESPLMRQNLNSGVLEVKTPKENWRLRATLTGPKWEK
ncbi:hypothetical protein [Microseira wollei]|uniref:Uncharacterized protein n=1 Tax=Microseira wollei NIES-4236 TaxID=2530354 RepID=A0AAV3XHC0_9CYAN|nr:hypothetical protein [Microseira wollei]GET41300.1 hypothetical protein MiSe_61120 [Microseira wollei NIES-4236]